uniref:STIM activating enhancer n=1 Tax=Oryzias sinensis TaxID=183150 RepID=A0A8C7XSB7_9TELE
NISLKRFREPKHERRPWRIWFLDTSKQAIGMLFIHFANVYLSDLTEEDPCSLYLINFLLDASLGMLVIYAGVRVVSAIVEWKQWDSLRFGEYGKTTVKTHVDHWRAGFALCKTKLSATKFLISCNPWKPFSALSCGV